MEISIGIIGRAGKRRPVGASLVRMRCHDLPVRYVMPELSILNSATHLRFNHCIATIRSSIPQKGYVLFKKAVRSIDS
jgi:hypothetical protein